MISGAKTHWRRINLARLRQRPEGKTHNEIRSELPGYTRNFNISLFGWRTDHRHQLLKIYLHSFNQANYTGNSIFCTWHCVNAVSSAFNNNLCNFWSVLSSDEKESNPENPKNLNFARLAMRSPKSSSRSYQILEFYQPSASEHRESKRKRKSLSVSLWCNVI